jgi:glycosyl transferase family 25
MNLSYNVNLYDTEAYVITLKDNAISETMSKRCQESCIAVQMPYQIWYAIDGTGPDYVIPDHLKTKSFLSWIKQANDKLTRAEIATFITHLSLWEHCMTINKPIVILEHDAVMIKKYDFHRCVNMVYYLGSKKIYKDENNLKNLIPPWYQIRDSYNFINCAHAYAIDPFMAKNLFCDAIKNGIIAPVDNFIRVDKYCVVQQERFAYEESGISTIEKSS